jgi:uncharacterized metal-binding protein
MAENGSSCSGTCGAAPTLIASCSGRSNVGQIANQVMVEVDKAGAAKSFCISGVGAGLSGFVESAKAARLVLVDGCPMQCGKKVLEKYQVEPYRYFVVTEMGIKKEDTVGDIGAGTRTVVDQVLCNV